MLLCLDLEQDMAIRGQNNFDYARLELLYQPSDYAIANSTPLTELQQYLGHPELYFLTNFQQFNEHGFDQDAISNLSKITAKHIDKYDPTQMLGRVNLN